MVYSLGLLLTWVPRIRWKPGRFPFLSRRLLDIMCCWTMPYPGEKVAPLQQPSVVQFHQQQPGKVGATAAPLAANTSAPGPERTAPSLAAGLGGPAPTPGTAHPRHRPARAAEGACPPGTPQAAAGPSAAGCRDWSQRLAVVLPVSLCAPCPARPSLACLELCHRNPALQPFPRAALQPSGPDTLPTRAIEMSKHINKFEKGLL